MKVLLAGNDCETVWVLEPVGLAEEVGRSEESLHFKHQFQILPTALCLDLLAAAG